MHKSKRLWYEIMLLEAGVKRDTQIGDHVVVRDGLVGSVSRAFCCREHTEHALFQLVFNKLDCCLRLLAVVLAAHDRKAEQRKGVLAAAIAPSSVNLFWLRDLSLQN